MEMKKALNYLKKDFECDSYEYFCELRDCLECRCFWEAFEEHEKDGDDND